MLAFNTSISINDALLWFPFDFICLSERMLVNDIEHLYEMQNYNDNVSMYNIGKEV